MRIFSDPATSSKIPALHRPGFQKLAGYARPGDTVTVSQLHRLCRGPCRASPTLPPPTPPPRCSSTSWSRSASSSGPAERTYPRRPGSRPSARQAIPAPSPHRTARRPRPGTAGLPGRRSHRRPRPRALRQPRRNPDGRGRPAAGRPEPVVTDAPRPEMLRVEMPGKVARYLLEHDGLGEAERQALEQGRAVRRGQGLQPSRHRSAADPPRAADRGRGARRRGRIPADRKAYRIYSNRWPTPACDVPLRADRS